MGNAGSLLPGELLERVRAGAQRIALAEVDELVRALLADDAGGVSHHGHARRDVLQDDCAGADNRAVADLHIADHLASRAEINPGAYAWSGPVESCRRTHEAHLADRGVLSDDGSRTDVDRAVVADVEAGADPRGDVELDTRQHAHR